MQNTIEVRGLRKRYGRTVALDGLSFRVEPGHVTGFVGPNGAGKSTTMRVILGLDYPDEGTALVGGRRYRTLRTPLRQVGALLDAGAIHPGRRARDHLLWMAHSNGLPARRVDDVLDLVGLRAAARRRTRGYSLGMRQRLGIAAALLGDPPVLMFDEPVNGLDPEGVVWIRGLLRGLAAEGRAVLVASHLMSELEDTADHLVIVGRGRLIADTTVRDLLAAGSDGRVLRTTDRRTPRAPVRSGCRQTIDDNGLPSPASPALIVRLLASGLPVMKWPAPPSLEQAYLALTRDSVEFSSSSKEA